jgi:hypothetical protein
MNDITYQMNDIAHNNNDIMPWPRYAYFASRAPIDIYTSRDRNLEEGCKPIFVSERKNS